MADGVRPEAPEWLSELEKEIWNQLCLDIESMGIQSQCNREVMIAYVTAYSGWLVCREMVIGHGFTGINAQGNLTRHHAASDMHKFRDQMNKLLPEFGLTPSSRSKLVSMKSDEEESPFAGLLEKLQGRN